MTYTLEGKGMLLLVIGMVIGFLIDDLSIWLAGLFFIIGILIEFNTKEKQYRNGKTKRKK